MSNLPLTRKCPRGEEWPAESFKSLVDCDQRVQTHSTITFYCPAGHEFKLKRAVASGMFTPEEALKIIAYAQKQMPRMIREAKLAERIEREGKLYRKIKRSK